MSLLDAGHLYIARGGSVVPVLFSLGWLFVLGVLSVFALVALAWQYLAPARPIGPSTAPLPGWSKPALAVLGSAWLGIGAGLLTRPGFWGGFVPWATNRADAQALGVWALALGVGVLGALAEDDLTRTGAALIALPCTAVTVTVVLACRASAVDWHSGRPSHWSAWWRVCCARARAAASSSPGPHRRGRSGTRGPGRRSHDAGAGPAGPRRHGGTEAPGTVGDRRFTVEPTRTQREFGRRRSRVTPLPASG